jgi:uncharacterized protein YceK
MKYLTLPLIVCIYLSGCSSVPRSLPCHDGWLATNDQGGNVMRSKVWEPSAKIRDMVARDLPSEHELACFHRYPDGNFVVVSYEPWGDKFATDYTRSGNTYIKGETSLVITLRH